MATTLVWITGASSGLGAALAATVPFDDAHVVDISRSGGTDGTEHLPADLADPASWHAVENHLLARLAEFSGERAVFLHNAGTLDPIGFAGEVDSAAYRTNVLLNSACGQYLGHAFLRALGEADFSGDSLLAMVSSGAASTPYPGWSSYSAGKAALDMWVRTVGAEQAERGSRTTVLSVAPGVVATAMQARIRSTDESDFPAVGRFVQLHEDHQLREPADAAADVWSVLTGSNDSGAVLDVRTAR
jgi:benzil reductase ((S)-benzoin forming)